MAELSIIKKIPENVAFKSEGLNRETANIINIGVGVEAHIRNAGIEIAKALGRIDSEGLYKEDGFKSVSEYGMTTFGWEHANASRMAQVGRALNEGRLPEGNFTVNHYGEMLRLQDKKEPEKLREKLEGMITTGELYEGMRVLDVREVVNNHKNKNPRKPRAEKTYIWYLDGVPGRKDITATESTMESAENVDAVQRVNFKTKDAEGNAVSIVGYLVSNVGQIRFYSRGIEAPVAEAEANTVEENGETE